MKGFALSLRFSSFSSSGSLMDDCDYLFFKPHLIPEGSSPLHHGAAIFLVMGLATIMKTPCGEVSRDSSVPTLLIGEGAVPCSLWKLLFAVSQCVRLQGSSVSCLLSWRASVFLRNAKSEDLLQASQMRRFLLPGIGPPQNSQRVPFT